MAIVCLMVQGSTYHMEQSVRLKNDSSIVSGSIKKTSDTKDEKEERPVVQRLNTRLMHQGSQLSQVLDPIIEYAQEPLLPLKDACAPLNDIVSDLPKYVSIALERTPVNPPDKLTKDEAAAIHLYTMEWENGQKSLYSLLNLTLRAADRTELKQWFKYLKLFLTALVKIPCKAKQTVWRGVRKNISDDFSPGAQVVWWSFSSCTTSLTVLESDMYLGNVGERTLFSIELINGRTIRNHSHFDTEDEILMLPGTCLEVQSRFSPAPDLHIVHLKQVVPKNELLAIPFQGARLFPAAQRHWYRKKRFSFIIALLIMSIIIASVFGSRAMQNSPVILLTNNTNISSNSFIRSTIEMLEVGETYSSIVTGTNNGSIYGTNIYTADSHVGTAAVHAGVLGIGETKNLSIKILPGQPSYSASVCHNISSLSYGPWTKSYSFLDSIITMDIAPDNLKDFNGQIGETVFFTLIGTIHGDIYGTDNYTDDSDLATAAIHAGVLRKDETRNISVKILPGQTSYRGSIKNGISSFSYGAWRRSYSFN